MSWSFSGRGKPDDVRAEARKSLFSIVCMEPEESIKLKVANILEMALNAYPDGMNVSVTASGSQAKNNETGRATNTLRIEITPFIPDPTP